MTLYYLVILVQTASGYDDIMLPWRARVVQDVMAREGRVQDVVPRTARERTTPSFLYLVRTILFSFRV